METTFIPPAHSQSSLGTGTYKEVSALPPLVKVHRNWEITAQGVRMTGGTVISAKTGGRRGADAQQMIVFLLCSFPGELVSPVGVLPTPNTP